MGLYNAIFGTNQGSAVILATLGLSVSDVGRFRDVWVEPDEKGGHRVAVYTRNGMGNRECGCYDSSDERPWASPGCKGHSFEREEDEYTQSGLIEKTGRRITVRRYVCEAPDSVECACTGCIISYRLPKHPLYLFDRDDEFDGTYATVYFSLPEAFADDLRKIAEDGPVNMSENWTALIDSLDQRLAHKSTANAQEDDS